MSEEGKHEMIRKIVNIGRCLICRKELYRQEHNKRVVSIERKRCCGRYVWNIGREGIVYTICGTHCGYEQARESVKFYAN